MMSEEIFNDAIYLDDVPETDWLNYIGKGYRSVIYTTDHERNGRIILFGYDTVGNPTTFICPHRSWIKYRVKYDTEEIDIYDKYVATKTFKNSYDRKKYLEGAAGLVVIEALRPEQEFLQKLFYKDAFSSDFNKQPLRIHTLDIETEISDQFEKPVDARNRINMITIHDSKTDVYYTWSLEHAEIDFKDEPLCNESKDRFEFFEFQDNETKLLEHFLDWWETNCPDVVSGWNINAYDIPYIYRRLENVLGKEAAQRLSPVKKCFVKQVNHDNERANVQADIEIAIDGIFAADLLVLYRDKFHIKGALDGGYNLSNVGEAENLGRKIEYDGTLKDLYMKDYQKFYEYNVRDVDLCVRIEDKCKMIPLARQITSSGLCNYNTIYSSISYLIGSVIAFSKLFMERTFNSYVAEKKEKVPYEGAYVFPPKVGLYKGGIATIDVNSLYPSTIRSLNLSPETYVGKVVAIKPVEDTEPIDLSDESITTFRFYPRGENKGIKIITKDDLLKLLDTKCIFTKNNTLFLKHKVKWGVIAKWCEHFYNLRKKTKKEMAKNDMKLYKKEITDPAQIAETKTLIQNLNSAQLGYKTMINSVYGILGTNFSPIYNPDLAQSITRNGRFFNISASKYVGEFFKKNFGTDDSYPVVASGDTDSFLGSTKIRIRY